jgi:hypothetical protein
MAKKQVTKKIEKPKAFHELYTDTQYVDGNLSEYLNSKGLEYRWINLAMFKAKGFHKTGWVPFKRDDETPETESDKLLGRRADGFIVRGDQVLAVKTTEQAAAYKAHILEKNRIMSRSVKKEAVSQLKSAFADHGIKAEIHEGYEENE